MYQDNLTLPKRRIKIIKSTDFLLNNQYNFTKILFINTYETFYQVGWW